MEVNKTDIGWIKEGMKTLDDRMKFQTRILVAIFLTLLANIVTFISVLG